MKTLHTLGCTLIACLSLAQEPAKTDSSINATDRIEIEVSDKNIKAKAYSSKSDTSTSDTTRIELRNAYITIVNKNKKGHHNWDDGDHDDPKTELTWWRGIDLGVNGILGSNYDFQLNDESYLEPEYDQSRYIAFNIMQAKGRLIKDYVGITTGLTFQIYNYKFNGDSQFLFTGDSLLNVSSEERNVSKNKLRVSYLGVPIMLEFNTSLNPDKSFHVSAGVVGKIRIENMYKQKYSFEGSDYKTALRGDLGFNRWGADAMVRIGYRRLTAFGQVGLLPLFDNKNTGDVYPFVVGLFLKI